MSIFQVGYLGHVHLHHQVELLVEALGSQGITMDDKELRRLERATKEGKIPRSDFVDYAKGSKAVKSLLEKEGRPATPGSARLPRLLYKCF